MLYLPLEQSSTNLTLQISAIECVLWPPRLASEILKFGSVQLSHSVMSDSVTPWTARPPCPSPTPGACSNTCPLSRWCHPTISSSVIPFSPCLQSFPAAAAKSHQSCLTLCDPIDSSPPGSPVPAILQARILEWVAISFSSAWKWKVKVKLLSRVRLFATP